MKFKASLYLLVLLLIFLFPQKIKSAESGTVHFYNVNEDGSLEWGNYEAEFDEGLSETDKAVFIFGRLFEDEEIPFIPDGVKVLGVSIFDGCLNLNVSEDILNYGGTYYEIRLKNQIIKTALSMPNINKVSLMIENLRDHLQEGSIIKEESRWREITDTETIEAGEKPGND